MHSQVDIEEAELQKERHELHTDSEGEHKELAAIYVGRGLEPALAEQVAVQLMAHNALDAHARDELGITDTSRAKPLQAALASALCFATGAALPLLIACIASPNILLAAVSIGSLLCLLILGSVAARAGGASVMIGAMRIGFWGAMAMAITAGVGTWLGHAG